MNNNREHYKHLLTKDYQIVRVHPHTGEVCTTTVNVDKDCEVMDFNCALLHEVTYLIGYFTIRRFEPFELYWSYEIARGEYMGGKLFESTKELVDFYNWFAEEVF